MSSRDLSAANKISRAITVKPAWGWLIMHGVVDIENRTSRVIPGNGICVVTFSRRYAKPDHDRAVEMIRAISPRAVKAVPSYEVLQKLCGRAVGYVNYEVLDASDSKWHCKGCVPWRVSDPVWFKTPFAISGRSGMWRMKLPDVNQSVAQMR